MNIATLLSPKYAKVPATVEQVKNKDIPNLAMFFGVGLKKYLKP